MKIIDFRLRPPYKGYLNCCSLFPVVDNWVDNEKLRPLNFNHGNMASALKGDMKLCMEENERAGISLSVVQGRQACEAYGSIPNDDIIDLVQKYPDKFVGVAGIDLSDPKKAIQEIKRTVVEYGFKGVCLEPGWNDPSLTPDDPSLMEIYETINDLKTLCLITANVYLGPNLDYSHPKHIQPIAKKFPEMTIILNHACWPHALEAVGVAHQCQNVYLLPDFYMYVPDTPGAEHYIKAANTFLKHRTVFGSGYPVRALEQAVDQMMALPIDKQNLELIMYKNAERLLKL